MTTESTEYRALDMLTERAPKIRGREPFWRPAQPTCTKSVFLPAWSWQRADYAEFGQEQRITLDVNGAYLAAASSAVFAHGALIHDAGPGVQAPGYYQITVHPWTRTDIVSPLGTAHIPGDRVWVAHPTALLLQQLSLGEEPSWPSLDVHDAWTATETMRLRRWTEAVQIDRLLAIQDRAAGVEGAAQRYKDIKDGYSIAVQMFRGPAEGEKTRSKILRPDWYATVHAQHAASTWRKAWNALLAGCGPIRMGSTDAITWPVDAFAELQFRSKPIIRIDSTGETLGAFKVRTEEE